VVEIWQRYIFTGRPIGRFANIWQCGREMRDNIIKY